MAAWFWAVQNWFELFQTFGIIGGLFFTAYTIAKDDKSRKIANLIAIKQQHREIWKEIFHRPKLLRILKEDLDLSKDPVTDEEELFVKFLFLHLAAVHRAQESGMFVDFEGLDKDIREFMKLPIPKAVWISLKPFQNQDFVAFIEGG